jgi:transposase-like protein
MVHIFADISSLVQYIELLKNEPEQLRLNHCLCCGKSNPWRHGGYSREADRINPSITSLNPVFIQRYYCPSCQKTCSVLPECIPPRRWYLWDIHEVIFLLYLSGLSAYAVAKVVSPSRQTIKRWLTRFIEQFCLHKDALCTHFHALGRSTTMADFWQRAFQTIRLSTAMRLCHVSGVAIP